MNPILKIKQKISVLAGEGLYSEAAVLAKQLVEAHPDEIEVWWVLAQLHQRMGEIRPALYCLSRVCDRPSPVYQQAIEKSVDIAMSHQCWDLALAPARELAKIQSDNADAWFKLGLAHFFMQQHLAAILAFERALSLDAGHRDALNRCGMSYGYIGQGEKSRQLYERSLAVAGTSNRALRLRTSSFLYLCGLDESEVFDAHKAAASAVEDAVLAAGYEQPVTEKNRETVRVGFCSEDFRRHSVASFLLPIFRQAGTKNWEIYCYSDVANEDAVTQEFKSLCHGWCDAKTLDDGALYHKIRDDNIDVLFDLMGYFGQARLGVFAARAAPIQVNYLGYPHTSGLSAMDYRLVDRSSDPDGDQYFTESLYRLPESFLCYEPPPEAPEVNALPAINNGYITFASFNSMQKFSEQMLDAWATILLKVKSARLIIKSVPLGEAALAEQMYARFEKQGVERHRIEVLGLIPSLAEHLALYGKVDIHLDTHPYNGTTTTCEALWQGVPTVTLAGSTHRSRVGCSLLQQVGLEAWVAETVDEYVDKAVQQAEKLDELAELRKGLRTVMKASPLTNGVGMVNALDDFFNTALQASDNAGGANSEP
ncbi:MAG: hypothetical protein C9356_13305 [Oleiphilus sp.]|nr:MAG: hypothetical protein C9356_13305 [Oleiphilus sp.]